METLFLVFWSWSWSITVSSSSVLLSGRLLNFKIIHGTQKLNISVLYGYTGSEARAENMELITDLLATSHDVFDTNLILGDFNFVDNDLDRTNRNRVGMNQTDVNLNSVWAKFIGNLDLSDAFRIRNPERKMFSYVHTQHGAKSRIDRVYTNDENVSNIFQYKHTPTAWRRAHRIVSFVLREEVERE